MLIERDFIRYKTLRLENVELIDFSLISIVERELVTLQCFVKINKYIYI